MFDLDVSQPNQWEDLANYIRLNKIKINGLINNAGITLRKTVTKTSPAEWDHLIRINLNGAFYGIYFIAPLMEENASIVNISSTAGLTGYFSAAYTASKWGLRGLTKAAAIELAPRKIRVNTICPGLVETPMMMEANSQHNSEQAKAFHEGNRQATPLDRGASPEEIAEVAVFLYFARYFYS
nr:SDR family oxidoreductase [Paenalcaligenes hominis]